MSKIVVAINVMITQREKITNVQEGKVESEIFFLYDKKHKWSMMNRDDGPVLFYYPGNMKLEDLAAIPEEYWSDEVEMVPYRVKDIGTKEAKQTFAELYGVLKEMKFGMDKVLDDIISSDIPF